MTATNPAKAAILVELPRTTTFAEAEEFVVKAQELGSCVQSSNPRQFMLAWEAPDLWLLRGLLEDVSRDLGVYFGYEGFGERIDNATNDPTATNLTEMHYWVEDISNDELARLRRYRTLAHSFLNIVTCPACGLPAADGLICPCGNDE